MTNMASPEYLKSKDAEKLWCPIHNNLCKGGECMLWRWAAKNQDITDRTLGYCGETKPIKPPLLSQFGDDG